jgi:hypothetical protein
MRFLKLFLVFASLVSASPAFAQTIEERAQLDWVFARGHLIYVLDRAAWVATDDMRARIPDAETRDMRGWVVEPDGAAQVVTFFGGPQDAPVAHYRGRVEHGRVVSSEVFGDDSLPPLTLMQRRLASALDAVRSQSRMRCVNQTFNSVAIPPDPADAPIDVYFLTPQIRANEWPGGAHYRYTVAANGTVLSSRAFTNTCITLGGGLGSNERVEALFITHLLDPLPTEIHVFTMWTSRLPLGVGTQNPDRTWWISSQGIELTHAGG